MFGAWERDADRVGRGDMDLFFMYLRDFEKSYINILSSILFFYF